MSIPVVSGNVSLYNESPERRVFPTPAIGMVGYTDNYNNLIRNSFLDGESVILIGNSINNESNVGGSLYHSVIYDALGGKVQPADSKLELNLASTIFELNKANLLGGCVDVSEGGLFGALFEGLIQGNTGFNGNLLFNTEPEVALFGEIPGRYVISTNQKKETLDLLNKNNIPYTELGVCGGAHISFNGYNLANEELFGMYNNSIANEME
jgi:phosphoribosylformylglycinamidine synthase